VLEICNQRGSYKDTIQRVRSSILVILEQHEELPALSGERWHEIIANDGQLAESGSPDVEDMTEDYSLTEELEYISFYTGSLIEMLPSIRSLRYAYILDLEERHAEERLQVPSDNTTHPIIKLTEASSQDVDNQSTHLTIIRQNVFLCSSLKDALRAEEDFARKEHGPGVTEFSPELEAQENRLQSDQQAQLLYDTGAGYTGILWMKPGKFRSK
jgi:hypothetical protein